MAQSINKIHSSNTIVTNTDDCFYVYHESVSEWVKPESTTYYKYFDTDVTKLTHKPDSEDEFNINDYLISYKSITNHMKFSESFKANECKINDISMWTTIGINQPTNIDNYKFPNTGKIAALLQSNNLETETYLTEHSLNQFFYTRPNELYVASCMVKPESSANRYIAYEFFDDTYGVGMIVNYDLTDVTGDYDTDGYKDIPSEDIHFVDADFNELSTAEGDPNNPNDPQHKIHDILSHFHNVSAGIYLLNADSPDYYFRLVLRCSCDCFSQMRFKLLILNNEQKYKYSSKQGQARYLVYTNAYQLEKHDIKLIEDFNTQQEYDDYIASLSSVKPSQYLITTSETVTLKVLEGLYKVVSQSGSRVIAPVRSKINYISNVVEKYEDDPDVQGVRTYLKSCVPALINPSDGDIAVAPSMISFSEYTRQKQNVNQDSVVRFGDTYHSTNPSETINYDLINSRYIIKEGDSYKVISFISEEKNRNSMVRAMTFNQGYFETWCKQDVGDRHVPGYNTGGGFNYRRIKRFYPKY